MTRFVAFNAPVWVLYAVIVVVVPGWSCVVALACAFLANMLGYLEGLKHGLNRGRLS